LKNLLAFLGIKSRSSAIVLARYVQGLLLNLLLEVLDDLHWLPIAKQIVTKSYLLHGERVIYLVRRVP
jgi:hypothetical protein